MPLYDIRLEQREQEKIERIAQANEQPEAVVIKEIVEEYFRNFEVGAPNG